MKTWKRLFRFAILLAVIGATDLLYADSAAELLQKGIYNEETVGNLDEAIKMYRKVVGAAKQTASLAAKAQYRLGHCLLKQGKTEDAQAAFESLVKNFPNQKEWVAKAKQHLPEALKLLPAPWKNGERLVMTMKLPTGRELGIVGLAVESGEAEGETVWNMLIRRFVAAGQNEGVSRVTVDQATNRPLTTSFEHTVLGNSRATWGDDSLSITSLNGGVEKESKIELDGPAFSNDQWFFGFRQLPLAVGYKAVIPLRVAFAGGNALDLEVHVAKKETIETPVGTFDCFRLETNISQTFWIADVPERYVARFQAEGVSADLTSIEVGEHAQELENETLGLSLTLPKGWFSQTLMTPNPNTNAGFRLIAPTMASCIVRVKDKELLDSDERESTEAWAQRRIKGAKTVFQKLTLRDGSTKQTTLAGVPATAFTVEQTFAQRTLVNSATLAFKDSLALSVGMTTPKDEFASDEAVFDSIRQSVKLR